MLIYQNFNLACIYSPKLYFGWQNHTAFPVPNSITFGKEERFMPQMRNEIDVLYNIAFFKTQVKLLADKSIRKTC